MSSFEVSPLSVLEVELAVVAFELPAVFVDDAAALVEAVTLDVDPVVVVSELPPALDVCEFAVEWVASDNVPVALTVLVFDG